MQPADKIFGENEQSRVEQYLNRDLESLHNGRRNTA